MKLTILDMIAAFAGGLIASIMMTDYIRDNEEIPSLCEQIGFEGQKQITIDGKTKKVFLLCEGEFTDG